MRICDLQVVCGWCKSPLLSGDGSFGSVYTCGAKLTDTLLELTPTCIDRRRSPEAPTTEPVPKDAAIEVADLRVHLANRDAQIASLIAAGDALGVDQTRPGWQRRWAAWMKAKGF